MRFGRILALRLLLVFMGTVIGRALVEAGLRIVDYRYSPLQVEIRDKSDWRFYHAFEDEHFVYDAAKFWAPRKGELGFDSHGFKGADFPVPKPSDEVRVFAIGDSNTLGWSGEGGASWPMFLEEAFRVEGRSVRVVNAGVYGYTSHQGLIRFEEVLAFEPDVVLFSFGGNDGLRVITSDADYAAQNLWKTGLADTLLKVRVGHLVLRALDTVQGEPGEDGGLLPRVSLQAYRENLHAAIELAEREEIQIFLLTRPFLGDTVDSQYKLSSVAYNRATIEVGRERGVPVIDVYARFKDQEQYFSDSMHHNEEGYRIAGRMLHEQLRSLIW